MASSQVEIPPSSRFGHVLRDRNHEPNSYRAKDSSSAFQKNFKDLVQTHLNSCISSHSRNSGSSNSNLNQRMDYADLWVHNPQGPNNVNNIDSSKSESNRISDDSNVNEDSNQRIDYTDLWVHIPERNNGENDHVGNTASGKWDRARDVVISIQRKSRDGMLSEPVSNSQRGESKNDAKLETLSTLQKANSKMKGEKNQNGRTLQPVRTREREKSPAQSECSVETQNFCGVSSLVSSLVQKWRGYEAEGKSLSIVNSPVCGSKANSGLFFAECPSFSEAPVKSFDSLDGSAYLKPVTPMTNEDSFADWESCKTGLSGPPSSVGRDSDATESERIRVADIIKKLSSSAEELTVVHEPSPRVRIACDQAEQRTFSPVSHSPRLRGRQVFCDLLMHIERERHRELEDLKECKAVSRFSHKGRIQAMLRLRLLRYGSELKDAPCSNYSLPDRNRNRNRNEPAILRKRLNSVQVDQVRVSDMTSQATEKSCDASGSREGNGHQLGTELANSPADRNSDAESSSESNPSGGGDINKSVPAVQQSEIHSNRSEILHQDHSNSSVTHNSTRSDSSTQKLSEFAVEEISLQDNGENSGIKFPEAHIPRIESINCISGTQGDNEEQEADTQNLVVSDCEWTSDVSHPPCEWEELHTDYMQLEDFNQDWISDVSRPRSTWEYLRQARYQEMCDPFQENADIRRLLERKSVSSFLSSGLRDRIDQLMVARTQNSIEPGMDAMVGENPTQMEEEQEERLQEEEKLHEGKGEEAEEEEEERQEECVGCNSSYKEDEDEKLRQNREATNYANETMSWVRDNASSDNHSDQAASPYIEGSPLSSTYSQETGPSSSFNNHNSIGIELMYELRGNMEQLRQEVAELRKSMKSCMTMQMELQKPFKKEVAPSFSHSGRKKRKDAPLTPKFNGGRCCICYDTQIDTLLYRCGHMCTCFNCAQKLQWGTGKCPVCRAPILDIVQAHFHP